MTRLAWGVGGGLVLLLGACARMAPNLPVEGAPYPLRYPYETPGLYAPTYPADAAERDRLRTEGLRQSGSVFHRLTAPAATPPEPRPLPAAEDLPAPDFPPTNRAPALAAPEPLQ